MVTNSEAVQLLLLSKNVNSTKENPRHLKYLNEFRTQQCLLFLVQQCQFHRPYTCFHWHFPNQKRRRPFKRPDGTFNYNPDVYCDKYDEKVGSCVDGEECPYAHRNAGDTERRYHPRYFKTGNCIYETTVNGGCVKNGLHCAFAHGPDDVRLPVYDIREVQDASSRFTVNLPASLEKERVLSEDPKWNEMFHVLACYKTELCKKPPRMCRQGYSCPFYHNGKDKRRAPDRWRYRSTPCPQVRPSDEWQDSSVCESGDACSYCHTRTEQQFHPEIYKSNKCNDVVNSGYCPRGPFCAFAHCDSEMKMGRDFLIKVQLQQQQQQQMQQMLTYVSKPSGADYQHYPLTTNTPLAPVDGSESGPPRLFSSPVGPCTSGGVGLGDAGFASTPSAAGGGRPSPGQQKQMVTRGQAGHSINNDSRKTSSTGLGSLTAAAAPVLSSASAGGSSPLMLMPASVHRVTRRVGRCSSPQQGIPLAAWQLQQQPAQQLSSSFMPGSLSPTSPSDAGAVCAGNSPTLISPRLVVGSSVTGQAQMPALPLPFNYNTPATAPPSQQLQQRLSVISNNSSVFTKPFASTGLARDLKAPGGIGRHRSGNSLSYSDPIGGLTPASAAGGGGGSSGASRHMIQANCHQQPKLSLDHLTSPQSSLTFNVGGRRYPVDGATFSGTATYPGGKLTAGAATAQPVRSNLLRACLSPTEDGVQLMKQHMQLARSTPRKMASPALLQHQHPPGSGMSRPPALGVGVTSLAIGQQAGLIDMNGNTLGGISNDAVGSISTGASGVGHQLPGLHGNQMAILSPSGGAVAGAGSLWNPANSPNTSASAAAGGPEGPTRPSPLYPNSLSGQVATGSWPWQSPHSPPQLASSSTVNSSSGGSVITGAVFGGPSDSGHNSETSATELDIYGGVGGALFETGFLEEHKRDSGLVLDFSLPASLSFADASSGSAGVGFAADASRLGISGNSSDSNLQQLSSRLSTVIGPTSGVTTSASSGCSDGAVNTFRQLFPYDHSLLMQHRFDSGRITGTDLPQELGDTCLIQSPTSSSIDTDGLVSFPMAIPGRCEADVTSAVSTCYCCCSRYMEMASNGTATMVTCSPLSSSSCCSSSSSILQHQYAASRRACRSSCILPTPQNTTSWPVTSCIGVAPPSGSGAAAGVSAATAMPASPLTDASFPQNVISYHGVPASVVSNSSLNQRQVLPSVLDSGGTAGGGGSTAGESERSDLMAAVSGVCPLATTETLNMVKELDSRSPSPVGIAKPARLDNTSAGSLIAPGASVVVSAGLETEAATSTNRRETLEESGSLPIGGDDTSAGSRCTVTRSALHQHQQPRSSFANLPQSPILMSSPFSNPGQDLERLTLQRQLNEREEELESLKRQRDAVTEHLRGSLDVIRQLFSSFHLPAASASTPGASGELKSADLSKPLYVDTADATLNVYYASVPGNPNNDNNNVGLDAEDEEEGEEAIARARKSPEAVDFVTEPSVVSTVSGPPECRDEPSVSTQLPGDCCPSAYAAESGKSQVELQQEALAALFSNPMITALLDGNSYPGLNDLLLLHAAAGYANNQQQSLWPTFEYDTQNATEGELLPAPPPTVTAPTVTLTTTTANSAPIVDQPPTTLSNFTTGLLVDDSKEADDLLSSTSGVGLLGDHANLQRQEQPEDGGSVSSTQCTRPHL